MKRAAKTRLKTRPAAVPARTRVRSMNRSGRGLRRGRLGQAERYQRRAFLRAEKQARTPIARRLQTCYPHSMTPLRARLDARKSALLMGILNRTPGFVLRRRALPRRRRGARAGRRDDRRGRGGDRPRRGVDAAGAEPVAASEQIAPGRGFGTRRRPAWDAGVHRHHLARGGRVGARGRGDDRQQHRPRARGSARRASRRSTRRRWC